VKPAKKALWASPFLVVVAIGWYFDSSVAKFVGYNRSDLLILGCEMLTEAGPRLQDTAMRHAEMLEAYKAGMKQRKLTTLISWCPAYYSKHRPEKGIDAAIASLRKVEGGGLRKNAVAVWKAGEQLMQFRGETTELFRQTGWYEPGPLPDQFMKKIEDANTASGKALATFEGDPNLLNAWRLCECNRTTMLRLFVGRGGYQCQIRLETGFAEIAKKAADTKRKWAAETFEEGSSKRELVEIFADSEARRCKILQAMRKNDMDEAHELMWEAIEKAIQKREQVLEIALELEAETRNWGEITKTRGGQ